MDRIRPALLALLVAVPFAALADPDVLGVPDIHCQTTAEWALHDYGPPSTALLVMIPRDGSAENCAFSTALSGSDCDLVASQTPPLPPQAYQALCATDLPVDWDGDFEFAFGGAYLVADSGDGATWGGLACYDVAGHHGPRIFASDALWGTNVAFVVASDASLGPAGVPDCGDGILEPCAAPPPAPSALPSPVDGLADFVASEYADLFWGPGSPCNPDDHVLFCAGSCLVPFGPGVDGAYTVLVGPTFTENAGYPAGATQGHIWTA